MDKEPPIKPDDTRELLALVENSDTIKVSRAKKDDLLRMYRETCGVLKTDILDNDARPDTPPRP